MNSKGQVSIFIILGVVLLLLTVVFLSSGDLFQKKETYEVTEKIDEQFIAAQKFVQNCLDTTARAGLEKLGSQGGYIDPVGAGLSVNYPSSKQGASAFKFTEGSNLVVPYWYYLSSQMDCSNNCHFSSKMPDLEGSSPFTIQSQLQTYIRDNIDTCLDGFSALSDAGYQVNATAVKKATVLIRDNDVRFYLSYPLEVSRGESRQAITQYAVDEPVPLRPMYNYAGLITSSQAQYTFLERHTISMISFNSGTNTRLLPPSSATTYDYISTIFWLKSRVKQQLQELFSTYTPGLQVANSRNFEPVTYAPDGVSTYSQRAVQRAFNNMVLPLNSSPSDDHFNINNRFDVNFEYLNWPIYFDVNSDGEVIRPHSLSSGDFFFGLQQFDTYYDISYPVRVVIHDSSAFKQDGFTFAFGLQSNVRGSSPLDENYTLLNGNSNAGTFVCNRDQYNSGVSKFKVVDEKTLQPISEASISFACGQETCTIGVTDSDGNWEGKLPICGGATMTFAKDESYAQKAYAVSTNLDEPLLFDANSDNVVPLTPFRLLNASVQKKLLTKSLLSGAWQFSNTAVDFTSKEFAVVSYKQVDAQPGTDPVQGSFVYYGGLGPTADTQVKLVPGKYEVTVQSISDEPLIIPEQTRSKRVFIKKIKFTIPEIKMDQFPGGTMTLNDTSGYWTVTKEDLDAAGTDAVTFFALYPDIPGIPQQKRVVEDLQIMNDVDKYTAQNFASLVPALGSSSDLPASNSNADSFISITPLFFNELEAGNSADFSINVVGSKEIDSVEILTPTVIASTPFAGSLLSVTIPATAFGVTPVTFKFKMSDGQYVTKTASVRVRSSSPLASISANIDGVDLMPEYELSNSTYSSLQLVISARFMDGSSRDITSGSYGTQYETTNDSVVDLGDNGQLLIANAGEANVTVSFDDKFVEIPITITSE